MSFSDKRSWKHRGDQRTSLLWPDGTVDKQLLHCFPNSIPCFPNLQTIAGKAQLEMNHPMTNWQVRYLPVIKGRHILPSVMFGSLAGSSQCRWSVTDITQATKSILWQTCLTIRFYNVLSLIVILTTSLRKRRESKSQDVRLQYLQLRLRTLP